MIEKIPKKPNVTVIVRAYNEESNIIRCLESLSLQNHPLQTVIVNNGSTDNTQRYVENFLAKNHSFTATVINEPQKGRGIALQRGIDYAETEIVTCLDADTYTTQSDWLGKLVAPLVENRKVVASSGRIKFYNGLFHHRLLYETFRSLIYTTSSSLGRGWLSLANCALRRSAYYKIGGTAELNGDYPEDRILALKLRTQGKIVYVNNALVYTHDWLLNKKTWATHLIDELDKIRDLVDRPESQVHHAIRPVSLLCAHWDQLKTNLREQLTK